MTESFNRRVGDRLIEVLSPADLPAEASTWPPEKVTLYWLSGQPQSWQMRLDGGAWSEIEPATADRLREADDATLDRIITDLTS